ncbi:MAG: extracellular solute-binding protein [Candidatus Omnitrophica bacterium]|nr:extracellular solute-binding protein [Candidatus Omnitrophota bacterium]
MNKISAGIIVFCLFIGLIILNKDKVKEKSPDKVILWHWLTDRDKVLQELARKYKEQTGVDVVVELYAPADSYVRKVTAAAQAKMLPDIYGNVDTKETFANYIRSGQVADLTSYFQADNQAWEASLFPKALEGNRFYEDNIYGVKPGIYGVPIDVTNMQLLYNKKLLAKAGFQNPPKDFAEFIGMLKALKRIGIPGFVSGWGELWLVDCFSSNYAFNIMGEAKVMATLKGDVPYTDPDWVKVFMVFKEMKDSGGLAEGIITKPNKYAEQDFALERAAFAFNGSWCVNVYYKMNPRLSYGVMLPPPVNDKFPMMIWGNGGSSFSVNYRSKVKERAVDFLKWMTAKEQQALLAKETMNLPSNREAVADIPSVLSDFTMAMDATTHPTVWKYNENPIVVERFYKGVQSIILGDKTPETVAQEVQEEKQKQIEREKRINNRKNRAK